MRQAAYVHFLGVSARQAVKIGFQVRRAALDIIKPALTNRRPVGVVGFFCYVL
jgi:hypothetical protein